MWRLRRHLLQGILTALALLLCSASARAGEALDDAVFVAEAEAPAREARPASGERRPSAVGVQEIIVMARKRAEVLQQVPVSVSAYQSGALVTESVRRVDGLDTRVPNLLVTTSLVTANSGRISIRGIGQGESTSTADPAVGIYLDGVYLARFQSSLQTLADIERVEVLRGPQGTLFGKNTVGGAINILTAQPSFEPGAEAELRVGNYDTFESRLVANVPILSETLAARLSLATVTRDGYTKNVLNGDEYSDNKSLAGRLQLLALLSENVSARLAVNRAREDRKPRGTKCVLLDSPANTSGVIAELSGFRQACSEDGQRSEFKFASDVGFAQDRLETTAASANLSWEISDRIKLVSISAWRREESELFVDADGTPQPILQDLFPGGRDVQDQWSQELQLSGGAMQGRLRFSAGLYALIEEASERDFFGPVLFLRSAGGGPVLGSPPNAALITGLGELPIRERVLKVKNQSFAGYGQLSYALTEKLDLTLGLRRTVERKRVRRSTGFVSCGGIDRALPNDSILVPVADCSAAFIGVLPPVELPAFERSARFGDWSPMATLAYSFTPDLLAYASYGTAFRSGGFNGIATRAIDTEEVDPEDLTSYEIGFKSTFLGGRMRVNAAGFYNVVEDFRIPFTTVSAATGLAAVSQGSADRILLRGGELEATVLALPGLQLATTLGVVRGKYEDFTPPAPTLSSNERLPDFPNYTMSFSADYERPVGALGSAIVHLDWIHRGSNESDFQGTDALRVSKVGLLNGRLGLALADGKTELALFGTNLLDRRYFDNGVSVEDAFGYALRFFAPPRMYGLEVRRRF